MRHNSSLRRLIGCIGMLFLATVPRTADGQVRSPLTTLSPSSPFLGGVPTGTATTQALAISIGDAIRRALDHNLAVLEADDAVSRASGSRRLALSELLPNVHAEVSETRQKISLEAFGLDLGPNIPSVVGPFNLFDARVFLRQSVVDLRATREARAESHTVAAARHSYQSARDLVVLVAANLYLQGLAGSARVDSTHAQLQTSQALYSQAQDLRQGGIVAGIDVVRAEVRLVNDRQRVTVAENDFQKTKLQLARVMGLPVGQDFTLSDQLPTVPVPEMTLETALERAYQNRQDYLAAQERVRAAEASRSAAASENLPSLAINGDYGAIGLTPGTSLATFSVSGIVTIPIFEGGRNRGRMLQATAELNSRRAESDDIRAQIYYDVRTSFLDLQATGEELQTAIRSRELSNLQLTQSRDRFAAGIVSNLEVVQAQEAVALANEQYIAALYGYNLSKALLATSLGTAEQTVLRLLGGSNP